MFLAEKNKIYILKMVLDAKILNWTNYILTEHLRLSRFLFFEVQKLHEIF